MCHCILNNKKVCNWFRIIYSTDPRLDKLTYQEMFFTRWSNYMFQLYKNIETDFLGQIILELFNLKLGHFFGTPCIHKQNTL